MAAVYLAHHVKLNRPVALKVLSPPPDAEDSGAFEERFRLEAETLASLDHPNIVILHDFGDLEDGRFFLAMEFIDGPRLSDVLRDGPLPCERALNLIMQVCSGLRYAHKRGVVHRDLKPSNLLIKTKDDGAEQLKVVDFGLVKLTEADQSITRAGLILGSPHCMAPEQVKGLDVDHRADIYAIGVLLFRTLTGQYPFHGPNSAATMIAHLNQPVPTFFSVAPELVVPEGLEDIVRMCLAKTPGERYVDMKALMDDMAGCMNVPPEHFRSVSQSHSTIQRQVSGQGGGTWRYVAAVLAFLLIGGGGLSFATAGIYAFLNGAGLPQPAPTIPIEPEVAVVEPIAVPDPEPVVVEEPAEEPVIIEEPEVAPPPPRPRPRPRPVVKKDPPPTPPAPKEDPKEDPEEDPEDVEKPDDYLGLPEDLFD